MKKTSIGGQAIIEGVMMKAPQKYAVCVRKESGEMVTDIKDYVSYSKRNKILGVPIIRGVASFVESLVLGVKVITDSTNMYFDEEEPAKGNDKTSGESAPLEDAEKDTVKTGAVKEAEKKDEGGSMWFLVLIAVALAIGIFIVLPTLLTNLLRPLIGQNFLMNLIEGVVRLVIFLAYIIAISAMKDIKRVFMYHGAEHKTIACFEHEDELTPANAKKYSRLHPRCGTTYMFLVMVISILFFSLLGWSGSWLLRIGLRLLLLPVVAGFSYEVLKLSAKYDNLLMKIIRAPGLGLQRLTTAEPDESMLEVAIMAFNMATEGMDEGGADKSADKDNASENGEKRQDD